MQNIAVLVSGGGTNLGALIDAVKSGKIRSGKIVLVISSNPNAYALVRAAENEIPSAVINHKDYSDPELFDTEIAKLLESRGIDVVVLAGFMRVLGPGIVRAFDKRIINVHPSLIPAFCGRGFYGLKVHEAALEYGVKLSGATVHYVNEIPDAGEIILQKAVDVLPQDTPYTLQKRVMEQAEWQILPLAVEMVCEALEQKLTEAKQGG